MYDVIVAGAGPAGNIAARRMAGKGHRVAVLDQRERLGDKLCTGIVGRECIERFPPDERDIFRDAESATVVAPSGRSHRIARSEPQAYIIDRVAFVESLAMGASAAGADYRLGERIVQIDVTESGVSVRTASRHGWRQYDANVVVIASGFSSPLLRMVGLESGEQGEYMVGCQAEVVADGLTDMEVYLGDAISPGSFGWLVPLSDSRALVGLVSTQRLNGHMRSFVSGLRDQGKLGAVTKVPRRWGIPIRPLRRTFGDRVLLVGDAAGLAKPTTGGGIYYSLLSGEMAAASVDQALASGDFSGRRLGGYEEEWKAVFGKELRVGYYARRLYEAMSDDDIEQLLSAFLSESIHGEFMSARELSFDWHSRIILKAVAHRELGRLIGSFGPLVSTFVSQLARFRFT